VCALLIEKALAKINLALDVLYKRPDHYHEVEMVMQTIDLYDTLTFVEDDVDQITLTCDVPYLPLDERNLVYQAARLVKETFRIRKGLKIHIEKRIPVAAGLGGGSSDAAATLRALNHLWGLCMSLPQLAELGKTLGSDVPFCVYGGTAWARGRGEIVEPLPDAPAAWVVLTKPPFAVSTADIYNRLLVSEIQEHPSCSQMIKAIVQGDLPGIAGAMGNVLETITFQLHPEVKRLKERILRFGAMGALMSGSGPSVFGITDRESKAQRIYNGLRGFTKEVYLSRFYGRRSHR
jgi:4-diphosphocytidyl-2-C-methyl-D-erythritol kinase